MTAVIDTAAKRVARSILAEPGAAITSSSPASTSSSSSPETTVTGSVVIGAIEAVGVLPLRAGCR